VLLVGLGNPGSRYRATRHNVGFEVVDRLVSRWGAREVDSTPWYELWECERAGSDEGDRPRRVWLMKPLTYMNRSGEAIEAFCRTRELSPTSLIETEVYRPLIVIDDMALPVGRIRFRARGSDGGHNGLSSISRTLGTDEYARLRIGVGPPPPVEHWVEFVLAGFTPTEREVLDVIYGHAEAGLDLVARLGLGHGLSRAMSEFNRVDETPKQEDDGDVDV
jgi:PTH1 family peptidyl-tRNA hydrolase